MRFVIRYNPETNCVEGTYDPSDENGNTEYLEWDVEYIYQDGVLLLTQVYHPGRHD